MLLNNWVEHFPNGLDAEKPTASVGKFEEVQKIQIKMDDDLQTCFALEPMWPKTLPSGGEIAPCNHCDMIMSAAIAASVLVFLATVSVHSTFFFLVFCGLSSSVVVTFSVASELHPTAPVSSACLY